MTEHSDNAPMQVEVRDFGPIARADIELRPLTVFVGPSNTGKSYLAMLLYALHRGLGRGAYFSDQVHRVFQTMQEKPVNAKQNISEWFVDIIDRASKVQKISTRKELPSFEWIMLPVNVNKFVHQAFNIGNKHLAESIDNEILRCFGIGQRSELVRHGASRSASVQLRQRLATGNNIDQTSEHRLEITSNETALETIIPEQLMIDLYKVKDIFLMPNTLSPMLRFDDDWLSAWYLFYSADQVRSRALGSLEHQVYYLPSARTGIMHAHQVVVSSLIEKATQVGPRPATPNPVLSGVLADFLDQLTSKLNFSRRRDEISPVINVDHLLEDKVLQGEVKANFSEIGYPSFTYRPSGWSKDVPLMNASSMVSELAPIVLYLRHVVGRDDVLIIEEPESHLHPAMQVEVTRLLAAMVHAGIRVIVTTHSEWILETLANLVQSSHLPKKERENLPGGEWSLRPDQVGAWMFEPKKSPKGSIVKEIPLDPETGTFRAGYETITESLYNDWATIFNSVRERNGQ